MPRCAKKISNGFERQIYRNEKIGITYNAHLTSPMLKVLCPLKANVQKLFNEMITTRELSARGASAIWRLSRTIADIDDEENIEEIHVNSAFNFREEIL